MAAAVPVPGKPGQVYIAATGQTVQQESQYEGDFYDTVEFTTFVAGTKQDVFKTQTNKELHHTNLTQTKRVVSHATIKLIRIGAHVRQWVGAARPDENDMLALYELGNMRMLLGSTNVIAEGPLIAFPSGIGVTGSTTASDFTLMSNGVPSAAAAPRLQEQHDIDDSMDLNCAVRTDAQTWLGASDSGQPSLNGNKQAVPAAHVLVTIFLHGIITKPLGG